MPTKEWTITHPEKYLAWRGKLIKARNNYIKNNPNFQDGIKNPVYGKPAWNRGLTEETDERVRKYALTRNEKIKQGIVIPYFSGKKHTKEHRRKNSLAKMTIGILNKRLTNKSKIM